MQASESMYKETPAAYNKAILVLFTERTAVR